MGMVVIRGRRCGGGAGRAGCAISLPGAMQPAGWPGFPWGIFIVNITGGLLMGLIVELPAP